MLMRTFTCVLNMNNLCHESLHRVGVNMKFMMRLWCWNCRSPWQETTLRHSVDSNHASCFSSASPSSVSRNRGHQFFCSSTSIKRRQQQLAGCSVSCSSLSSSGLKVFVGPLRSSSCSSQLVERTPGASSKRFFNAGLDRTSGVALAPRTTSFLPDQDWVERQRLCPGCGIEMQDEDPKAPGFFQHPVAQSGISDGMGRDLLQEDEDYGAAAELSLEEGKAGEADPLYLTDLKSSQLFDMELEVDGGKSRWGRRGRQKGKQEGKGGQMGPEEDREGKKSIVCARCHALRNYGKVKDESVENLLPDFDFEHVVGTRLRKAIGRRAVVLMVVDAVDFDGTFPRTAAALLAETERKLADSWEEGKAANIPRLIIVVNKVDLLPCQVSPVRLNQWARRRSRAGGCSHISGLHVVSAFKGWGIDELVKQIADLAGPRGDVWVVGAQNVGKSSLINALGRFQAERGKEEKKVKVFLTEAARPGTTLGILKLEGILPGKARLLDTPGLLQPHQITNRLTGEELKMVQVRKILKPRTFRVKVGHAITIGGLIRMTVIRAPAESIYATVWASPFITCHMGKAESAPDLFNRHIGDKLQPPLSKERVGELGRWMARRVEVFGDRWNKSSVDVAVAGIGWIALALSGSAVVEVWTYDGVAVTVRDAMVLDLAAVMEKPGFTAQKSSGKGKK